MKQEWFLERWFEGKYIDRAPKPMTKDEAEMLSNMLPAGEFHEHKVVHKSKLQTPIDQPRR